MCARVIYLFILLASCAAGHAVKTTNLQPSSVHYAGKLLTETIYILRPQAFRLYTNCFRQCLVVTRVPRGPQLQKANNARSPLPRKKRRPKKSKRRGKSRPTPILSRSPPPLCADGVAMQDSSSFSPFCIPPMPAKRAKYAKVVFGRLHIRHRRVFYGVTLLQCSANFSQSI